MNLKDHIRAVPNFPKPGILFYDIGTLIGNGPVWQHTVNQLTETIAPLKPDYLVGIESRGFIVTAPLAARLGIGFAMVRKKGKLPGRTIRHDYKLEYGSDTVEIQEGVLKPDSRVLICDDLLATGGTARAAIELVEKVHAHVLGSIFIVELNFLNGRQKLGVPVTSLVSYDE